MEPKPDSRGRWLSGTIVQRLGPASHLVNVGGLIRYVHIDRLRERERERYVRSVPTSTTTQVAIPSCSDAASNQSAVRPESTPTVESQPTQEARPSDQEATALQRSEQQLEPEPEVTSNAGETTPQSQAGEVKEGESEGRYPVRKNRRTLARYREN